VQKKVVDTVFLCLNIKKYSHMCRNCVKNQINFFHENEVCSDFNPSGSKNHIQNFEWMQTIKITIQKVNPIK